MLREKSVGLQAYDYMLMVTGIRLQGLQMAGQSLSLIVTSTLSRSRSFEDQTSMYFT